MTNNFKQFNFLQKIKIVIITSIFAFSIIYFIGNNVGSNKEQIMITTGLNHELNTVSEEVTTSITTNDQNSHTKEFVLNYINTWKLTDTY